MDFRGHLRTKSEDRADGLKQESYVPPPKLLQLWSIILQWLSQHYSRLNLYLYSKWQQSCHLSLPQCHCASGMDCILLQSQH